MPSARLCPPGSRDFLVISHDDATASTVLDGGFPYIRYVDLETGYQFVNSVLGRGGEGTNGSNLTQQIVVSPVGDYIFAVASGNPTTLSYRGDTKESLPALTLPVAPKTDVANDKLTLTLSPDGELLYINGGGSTTTSLFVKVPELQSVSISLHPAAVLQGRVAWSKDMTRFVQITSVSPYIKLVIWPGLGNLTVSSGNATPAYKDLALSDDGLKMAVASTDATLMSGVCPTASSARTMLPSVGVAHKVCITPDGLSWMFSNLATGVITFISVADNSVVTNMGIGGPGVNCEDIKFSSDGKYVLVIYGSKVQVYRWSDKYQYPLITIVGIATIAAADIGPVGYTISNELASPVRDGANNPVAGVKVVAYVQEGYSLSSSTASTVTDVDGRYTLPCISNLAKSVAFLGATPTEASVLIDWVIPA
jgi:WD40 repeat protein